MVFRGFESSIFRHGSIPTLRVRQAERPEKLAAGTRNSKHNRYCGGLLIRSSVDSGVLVQVQSVPPNITPGGNSENQ